MSEWESQERLEPASSPDEKQQRRAMLTVCCITGSAEQARPILEALGLIPEVAR